MNIIKRILGLVWIGLGVFAGYYLFYTLSMPKFATGTTTDLIPAIIYTFILLPLIVGSLVTFGIYSITGEYNEV